MTKQNEAKDPNSCWNKARDTEMTFILLARDPAAPAAIRYWINERIHLGKNEPEDDQLTEAEFCAQKMEQQRREKA